jgi:hypothetical protein
LRAGIEPAADSRGKWKIGRRRDEKIAPPRFAFSLSLLRARARAVQIKNNKTFLHKRAVTKRSPALNKSNEQ